MSFTVRLSVSARADLSRLYDPLCAGRMLEDLELAEEAFAAFAGGIEGLGRTPFIYRKAGLGPFLRELLVPFGHTGYVALFEIEDAATVTVLAVRHQREDDYH